MGRPVQSARALACASKALVVLTLIATACDSVLVAPPPVRVDLSHVTTELAAFVDDRGQFNLPLPPASAGEISRDQARALAETVVRTYLRPIRGTLEREHGGRIRFDDIRPCGRAFYALSPYEALSPTDPGFARRHVGPQWLFTFCRPDGLPQLSVAVSALATDVKSSGGGLVWSGDAGSEFSASGIPRGTGLPLTPEAAVAHLSQAVGHRVARLPVLELAGVPYAPQFARWRLTLESSARVAGGTPRRETNEPVLYVGGRDALDHTETLYRPVLDSATSPPESLLVPVDTVGSSGRRAIRLHRRAGVPRHFEVVTGLRDGSTQ